MQAIDEYKKYFPENTPSCFQQDLIESTVTDLGAWSKTLTFWAGNGYRAQSIARMLDYYEELRAKAKPTYEPPPPADCQTCQDAKKLTMPKEGRTFDWEVDVIDCPDCVGCVTTL